MKKRLLILGFIFALIFLIGSVNAFEWNDGTLVSYFKLDETSGTTAYDDLSTNNLTNTGMTVNQDGIIVKSYLGGNNKYLSKAAGFGAVTGDHSISLWMYHNSLSTYQGVYLAGDSNLYYPLSTVDGEIYIILGGRPSKPETPTGAIVTGSWQHIVITRENDDWEIWVDGTNRENHTESQTVTGSRLYLANDPANLATRGLDGKVDEIGVWNRTLNGTEIGELYNGGAGITYEEEEPDITVTLISPTNETRTNDDPITFLAQLTPYGYNLTNGTANIWYENGTLFTTSTNSTFSDPSTAENITFSISDWIVGNYYWNVQRCQGNCNGTNSSFADNNFTLEWLPFNNTGEEYNSFVLETSQQIFKINISTSSDWTVNNGRLIYDGTTYENADKEDLGGGDFQLTQTIYIPTGTVGFGSENRSFNWNITFSEIAIGTLFSSTTDENNQTVNELIFRLCGGTANMSVLNFTMYDEETGNAINAAVNPTTFQTTFSYGSHWNYKSKTYSIDNQSVATNEFDFCTDNSSNFFYTDMEAFYTATGYVNKNYFLNNASLNGSNTNEISLYLLNESNAIEFFISVEEDLSPITSATINIEKYFVGEGIYKTVEIDETSSDSGEFTSYLDLDKDYKFTISKAGSVLGIITKTASCKQAPCELTLSIRSSLADVYNQFNVNFAQNVVYDLSWNPNTKIVTFDFIDTTGLADYFSMKIWQGRYNTSSSLIIDSQLYTSSGTITGNLSNYTSGDFTVNVYVSRSPEIFIDFIKITMKEFVGKFGLLGLFFAFLLALTIIFGLSFNPAILCLSVPLSLTILNLIGILAVSWSGIVIVYVLAAIAVGAMMK